MLAISLLLVLAVVRASARNRKLRVTKSGSRAFFAFTEGHQHRIAFGGIRSHVRGEPMREQMLSTILSPPPSRATKPFLCYQDRLCWFALKAREKNGSDRILVDGEEVPLVFLHGMKGSHLAVSGTGSTTDEKGDAQRSWLVLGGLLNFPPKHDNDPKRDISLPLTYTHNVKNNNTSIPIQDRGRHFVNGTVDHVVELAGMLPGDGGALLSNTGNLDFFPFYGHVTKFLEDVNGAHTQSRKKKRNSDDGDDLDGRSPENKNKAIMQPRPTRSFCYDWRRNLFELSQEFHEFCEEEFPGQPVQVVAHSLGGLIAYGAMKQHPKKYTPGGVLVGVPFGTGIQYFQDMHKGYFTELGTCRQFLPPAQFTFSSHWSFFPMSNKEIGDSFVDVSEYFNNGETGDLNEEVIAFEADRRTIGKKTSSSVGQGETKWRPATPGKPIDIDFYDPEEWEKNEIGIFDPSYRHKIERDDGNRLSEYKKHMKVQMKDAKLWRNTVLSPWEDQETARKQMPPLTICSTVSIPTPNQILRRKRRVPESGTPSASFPRNVANSKLFFPRSLISLLEKALEKEGQSAANSKVRDSFPRSLMSLLEKATAKDDMAATSAPPQIVSCQWEYDYASGRTVPGDGRIDYDKSFPPAGTLFKTVDLNSLHAKQFCWEDSGGDLGTVWKEVNEQLQNYEKRNLGETIDDQQSAPSSQTSSKARTEMISRR